MNTIDSSGRAHFHAPAVLGITPMGVQIAALFATIGQRVKIYDRPLPENQGDSRIQAMLQKLAHFPQPALADPGAASLMIACNYRDHWSELGEHDLIIDAYDRTSNQKQGWFSRLAPGFAKHAVILSVSDGASISPLLGALPAGMRTQVLGVHFSPQPRTHRLIELIPTLRSEPRVLAKVADYLSNVLGAVVVNSPDHADFYLNRILSFAVNSAFAQAARQGLSAGEMESLSAMIMGRREGGLCYLLDQIGLEVYQKIQQRIPEDLRQHFSPLLEPPEIIETFLTDGKSGCLSGAGFYDYQASEPRFYTSLPEVSVPVARCFAEKNWAELSAMDVPQARFVTHYLRELWQFLMDFAQHHHLEGQQIDHLLRHGLGWQLGPYQLSNSLNRGQTDLSARVYGETNNPVAQWFQRSSRSTSKPPADNSFLGECKLLCEDEVCRVLQYHEKVLVWQPLASSLGFGIEVLRSLQETTLLAKRRHCGLMIYHQGEQFGGVRPWAKNVAQDADRQAEQEMLIAVLLGLRMLPHSVVLAVEGNVVDYGCAVLMQADQVVCEADVSMQLRAVGHHLPPLGGVWFEWLRRLPKLSPEYNRLQIHSVLCQILGDSQVRSLREARELGVIPPAGLVNNGASVAQNARRVANLMIEYGLHRPFRYVLSKLSDEEMAYLLARSDDSAQPALYRECVRLLADERQSAALSLRRFLQAEMALFNRLVETKERP